MNGQSSERAHWPEGVQPISYKGIGSLGVGPDNALYWDGKPVEVRRRLDLTWRQAALAWVVAIATVISAFAAAVQAVAAWRGMP